jgi:hypothetical protein
MAKVYSMRNGNTIQHLDVSENTTFTRLIGLDPVQNITSRLADDGFRVSCFILRSNKALEDMGIKNGDKPIVFQSLRYTKESLENASNHPRQIKKYRYAPST